MSNELKDLVVRIAELPQEQQEKFLIFGQGLVAGIELQETKAREARDKNDTE